MDNNIDKKLIKDILIGVKELLSEPGRWCKEAYAKDGEGERVEVRDSRASSWCIAGALNLVNEIEVYSKGLVEDNIIWNRECRQILLNAATVIDELKYSSVARIDIINDMDEFSHKDLMNWINKAIEMS